MLVFKCNKKGAKLLGTADILTDLSDTCWVGATRAELRVIGVAPQTLTNIAIVKKKSDFKLLPRTDTRTLDLIMQAGKAFPPIPTAEKAPSATKKKAKAKC